MSTGISSTGKVIDTFRFTKDGYYTMPNGKREFKKAGEELVLPVVYNTVLNSLAKLITSILKQNISVDNNVWWEVGSGDPTWQDNDLPNAKPTDTGLLRPTFRKKILSTDVRFLTPTETTSNEATNIVEISCLFGSSESNGDLREFSIYVGGSSTFSTGIPINRKIHRKIYKEEGIELSRKIIFEYTII